MMIVGGGIAGLSTTCYARVGDRMGAANLLLFAENSNVFVIRSG
ncbi:MAG: hypothetical protein U5R06_02985 [candidate division KSB1 bacterium]|nr:hypothetical protein [candidate division KSB1 bacterium]